jgi:hypothetical protein
MPSLHKDSRGKTPFYIAAYTDHLGRRRKRSTKETNKTKAQDVLNGWLKAEAAARGGRLTEARAREIVGEILESVSGRKLYAPNVGQYFKDWLAGEKPTVSEASYSKKDQAVRLFLESWRSGFSIPGIRHRIGRNQASGRTPGGRPPSCHHQRASAKGSCSAFPGCAKERANPD